MTQQPAIGRARSVLFLRTDPGTLDPRIQKESMSLANIGWEVGVYGWDRRGEYARHEQIGAVSYDRSRIRAPYGNKWVAILLPVWWLQAMVKIARTKPTVVHACDLDALIPALAMKGFLEYRIVYDVFDQFANRMPRLPRAIRTFIDACDRWCARRVDAILVPDGIRQRLIGNVGKVPMSIIMNVPTPFDKRSPRRGPGDLRVCYAGVIHEMRGLRMFGEAMARLDGVVSDFAGWIPRPEDAQYMGTIPHLSFHGKVSYHESLTMVAGSDVVLALYDPSVPINALASSNKVFEAMCAARPVITNSGTSMAPIVESAACGIIIPYGDVNALVGALELFRDNEGRRIELGENGQRSFASQYSWSEMEKRLISVYDSLTLA